MPVHTHQRNFTAIEKYLIKHVNPGGRILDIGCGNGLICQKLARAGFDVFGLDRDPKAVSLTQEILGSTGKVLNFDVDSISKNVIPNCFRDSFDCVISCEVIGHLYSPNNFCTHILSSLRVGGYVGIITPFHGYFKNLALSITGAWDIHLSPEWEGGQIKFWSIQTLVHFLENRGFKILSFHKFGRFPPLHTSMLVIAQKN